MKKLFSKLAVGLALIASMTMGFTSQAAAPAIQYTPHVEAAEVTSADGPFYIRVNIGANVVTVYKQDANGNYTVPVKAMVCSAGLNGTTPTGLFKTSDYYNWRLLVGGVKGQYSVRFYKGILFHSVPYMKYDKSTLQEGQYNLLGADASHGCIRLAVKDCKWIYDNCAKGTTVEVYSDPTNPGPLGKPDSILVSDASPFKGWDPTDPDGANPWLLYKQFYGGLQDMVITQGTAVTDANLLGAVKAFDFDAQELPVTVDATTLDVNTPGTYYITYSSTGKAGATIKQRVNVAVVAK